MSSATHCPACAQPMPADVTRCPSCGCERGEHTRCPHCHAAADVVPSEDARFVCVVCGGPRIVIDDPTVQRSGEQLELLKTAMLASSARATWRVVSFIVGGFGLFSLLVLWLAIDVARPPLAAALVAGLAVLVPFAFSILAFIQSRRQEATFHPTLERAWIAAARDIARAKGGELDAAQLAKLTRLGEKEAERLLSRMSAESMLRKSVTAEGNLRYTLVEPPPVEVDKRVPASP